MTFSAPLSEEAFAVLVELRRLAGASGKLRTSSCVPKLVSKLAWPRIAVDEAIRDLYRAGLLSYQADRRELPVSGHMTVSLEATAPTPQETAWRQAMAVAGLSPSATDALSGLASMLNGLSPEDLAGLAQGLRQLSQAEPTVFEDAGFNVSARRLLGSSKVLSMMSGRMLDVLGLPARLHNSSPRYVICAGPPSPVATLLIENPRAFENAVRSGLAEEVALICTYGFGLSYLGQEWLHTSETPDHDRPILIVREGSPPALDELLRAPDVFFWGDLDLAALGIYRALKRAIPQLKMSRIYEAMLPLVGDLDRSHPYADLFDKSGQVRSQADEATGLTDLDAGCRVIWHACCQRAVDQEVVDDSNIRWLGAFALET